MLDPVPPPPRFLAELTQPLADALGLYTLPLHAHEILASFAVYTFVNVAIAPRLSTWLFPTIYRNLAGRTKVNWDVHVVSLFQSCLINLLALYVIWTDQERRDMGWRARVWGYTGAGGMIQGFAAGYFVWDLMITVLNIDCFGYGMLAHAISALTVFGLGFRPFVNYYGPTFILYELSSPFLNFHWFFDKVNMTGSRAQLVNGIILLVTFFCCRLVWGTYQSVRVYQDVWAALQAPRPLSASNTTAMIDNAVSDPVSETMMFAGPEFVPVWLAVVYLGSNIVLNTLNFYWFGKMIDTVRKRFQPQPPRRDKAGKEEGEVAKDHETNGSPATAVSLDQEHAVRRRHA